jgi:hypothetical protein
VLSILFWILVGLVIGWNLPQPAWAKQLQDRVVASVRELMGKSKTG